MKWGFFGCDVNSSFFFYCLGRQVVKMCCKKFSERFTGRWAVMHLQLPCCPSKKGENLQKTFYKTFSTT